MRKDIFSRFARPTVWYVCFHEWTSRPWWNRIIPGPFRHVNAFGLSKESGVFVFYELAWEKTRILTCWNNDEAFEILRDWTDGAVVLEMDDLPGSPRIWRWGFWCTPAIAHLIGLRSGAVLPSTLYRHCLANGGRQVIDGRHPNTAAQQGPPGSTGAVQAGRPSVDPEAGRSTD